MAYTQDNIVNPGQPPLLWSDIDSAFRTINQNFVELYASVSGGSPVDFTNLSTNVSPSSTEVYDLGSSTKRWKDLYLSGSSLYLGDAVITATGTAINLPAGSTIAGSVLDNEYFRTIAVAGQPSIVADAGGDDTLTIASGNSGISITTNAGTDTLTITNSGVTGISGTAGQIGVSGSIGNVTLTNLGVTSIVAGFGMSVNQATGAVTVTNEGLAGLDAGIGITLSPRDPITGRITVTNSQPNVPQNVFSIIAVPTQGDLTADAIADTLTIQTTGNGLLITTDAITDTLIFSNTGVTSLAVGNGLTVNSGTGSINLTLDSVLSRNIVGDVTGSIFADDSTKLVDAVEAKIVGDIDTASLRTSEEQIRIGSEAGAISQGIIAVAVGKDAGNDTQGAGAVAVGASAGKVTQGSNAVAVGDQAGENNQAIHGVAIGAASGYLNQDEYAVGVGSQAGSVNQGQFAVALGARAGQVNQPANSIVINASGVQLDGSAAGFFVNPIRNLNGGTFLTYDTTTKEIGYSTGIRSENEINIEINLTDSTLRRWTFGEDGNLTLPNDGIVSAGGSGGLTLGGNFDVKIVADYTDNNRTWTFNGGDGSVTFPDGTVQETAWTGRNDIIGSVFADDSTLLVDAVNGEIPGYVKIADLKTALQDGAGDYAAFKAWVLANL